MLYVNTSLVVGKGNIGGIKTEGLDDGWVERVLWLEESDGKRV